MANKTLKKKVQAKPATRKPVSPVVDSVREFWFAGLGVFSVAQSESGRLIDQGNKFFNKLVAEGAKLEKKTLNVAETAVDDIKGEVESQFDIAKQQIVENWDGIGNILDERVLGTLDRLGIPTTKDLNKLSGRVQRMSSKAIKDLKELEAAFEERVSNVLKNLAVPTVEDLNKLTEGVQKVSSEAASNLVKLEKDLGGRVSGAISKLEAATAKEFETVNSSLKDVSDKVTENWDKLENVVEGRVKETMGSLGIPTADDINKLSTELQKLSRQVAAMEKKLNTATKPVTRKATVKKATVSKATASKKAAPKKTPVKS